MQNSAKIFVIYLLLLLLLYYHAFFYYYLIFKTILCAKIVDVSEENATLVDSQVTAATTDYRRYIDNFLGISE
jgi:hypothetical protein